MAKVRGQAYYESLALRRQKKGISLEEIADATKIGIRALKAIESGEFDKLPGGIYSTNYIRQYARLVEADEAELLDEYYSKMGITPALLGPAGKPMDRERKPISRLFRQSSAIAGS